MKNSVKNEASETSLDDFVLLHEYPKIRSVDSVHGRSNGWKLTFGSCDNTHSMSTSQLNC